MEKVPTHSPSPEHPSMQGLEHLAAAVTPKTIYDQMMQIFADRELAEDGTNILLKGNVINEPDLKINLRYINSISEFGINREIAVIAVKYPGLNNELVLDYYKLVINKGRHILLSPKKIPGHKMAVFKPCNHHQLDLVSDILKRSEFYETNSLGALDK